MKNSSILVKTVLITVLLFVTILNSFSQTGEKMKKGAGNGAALGALAGVIFGNGNILADAADGAVRGAATGAAVGLISGEVEKSKNKKAREEIQHQMDLEKHEMEMERHQMELDKQGQQNSEQDLVTKFGRDNVEAYNALLNQNHARAKALAGAGELSNDANHRIVAVWVKAMIAVDQKDAETANAEFDRIIELDPIIDTRDQVRIEVDKLVLEMRKERFGV